MQTLPEPDNTAVVWQPLTTHAWWSPYATPCHEVTGMIMTGAVMIMPLGYTVRDLATFLDPRVPCGR